MCDLFSVPYTIHGRCWFFLVGVRVLPPGCRHTAPRPHTNAHTHTHTHPGVTTEVRFGIPLQLLIETSGLIEKVQDPQALLSTIFDEPFADVTGLLPAREPAKPKLPQQAARTTRETNGSNAQAKA